MLKVAVIGLGRFGTSVARNLHRDGAEVLAVDRNMRLAEAIADEVSVAVGFDATDISNLQAYDIGTMDVVVVAIGSNFESSVLVTMLAKQLGANKVYAKALNPMQEGVLQRVGADHVIKPEEDMGVRLAEHLLHDSVIDFVELPQGYSLRRIAVPEDWVGQSLAELRLLTTRRLNLVQIIRHPDQEVQSGSDGEKIALPNGTAVLMAGDRIDVIGADKDLQKLG